MTDEPTDGRAGETARRIPTASGPAEVISQPGVAVWAIRWPLALPARPPASGLPTATWQERGGGTWTREEVPPGLLLEDLDLPPDAAAWRAVAADLEPALSALHAARLAHGAVAPARVWVDRDGRAWLLGAGARAGTLEGDRAALAALVSPTAPRDPDAGRAELRARVRAAMAPDDALDEHTEARPAESLEPTPPFPPERTGEPGRLDEVGGVLGDDGVRGLLDRTGESTGWSDRTLPGEPTGVLTSTGQAAHRRLAALARVSDGGPLLDLPEAAAVSPESRAALDALWARERPLLPLLPDAGPQPPLPWRAPPPTEEDTAIRLQPPVAAPPAAAPAPPRGRGVLGAALIFGAGVLLTLAVGVVLLLLLQAR